LILDGAQRLSTDGASVMAIAGSSLEPDRTGGHWSQKMKTFEYTVDGETQSTSEHTLTAEQIRRNAGLDPVQRYLIRLDGKNQKKLEMSDVVHMHEHMKFVTAFIGPVPVS
jgi:hypothetical protein